MVYKRKRKKSDSVLWQFFKPLYPQKNPKSIVTTYKNADKNFDYTTIADRLRTVEVTAVNPTGVVKPVYVRTTFPLTTTAV